MATDLRILLDPSKIIPHFEERRHAQLHALPPIAVEFHWCASCNYNCIHCSYGERRKNRAKLEGEVIEQTIDALASMGTKSIYISGGGEPTTLRGWDAHARRAVKHGLEVALITNSVAITPAHYELLSHFNYIAVSVYSTKEAQYKAIVGADKFARQFALPGEFKAWAKENVNSTTHALKNDSAKNGGGGGNTSQTNADSNKTQPSSINAQNSAPAKLPIIGARCVINHINYEEIFNTYAGTIDAGFDYCLFIPAVDYEKRQIALTEPQKAAVLAQIEQNAAKIDPKTTNLLNIKANAIGHYRREYLGDLRHSALCNSIMVRSNAFINYDGEVYLCQPLIGDLRYSIGNVNDAPFERLWNGEKHLSLTAELNAKFGAGACENCRAIAYNRCIDSYLGHNLDATKHACPNDNLV